jgi:hypothetical protein
LWFHGGGGVIDRFEADFEALVNPNSKDSSY